MQKGYAGTTMEEIADLAGIARRTVYNNYPDKGTLFKQIVACDCRILRSIQALHVEDLRPRQSSTLPWNSSSAAPLSNTQLYL